MGLGVQSMFCPVLSRIVRTLDKLLSTGTERNDQIERSGINHIVDDAIERHDRVGETSIGFAQAAIAIFILSLHLIAAFRHNFETFSLLVATLLSVLAISSLARIQLAKNRNSKKTSFQH